MSWWKLKFTEKIVNYNKKKKKVCLLYLKKLHTKDRAGLYEYIICNTLHTYHCITILIQELNQYL